MRTRRWPFRCTVSSLLDTGGDAASGWDDCRRVSGAASVALGPARTGVGTASPPAPRPGPCTRPRTGRCRGQAAGSRGARQRASRALRGPADRPWAALDPAASAAGRGHTPVGRRQAARPRPERFRGNKPSVDFGGIITASFTGADTTARRTAHRSWSAVQRPGIPASQAYPWDARPRAPGDQVALSGRALPAGRRRHGPRGRPGCRVCRRDLGAPGAGTTGAVGRQRGCSLGVTVGRAPAGRVPVEWAGSTIGSRRWRAGGRRPG